MREPAVSSPARWGQVFAHREYRGLWIAHGLSLAGDQLARVALAVLVFDRTGSALATAGAYAVTFLPWLVGGPLQRPAPAVRPPVCGDAARCTVQLRAGGTGA